MYTSVSGDITRTCVQAAFFVCSHNLVSVSSALQENDGSGSALFLPLINQAVSVISPSNAPAT